jgi:hypothetical protein
MYFFLKVYFENSIFILEFRNIKDIPKNISVTLACFLHFLSLLGALFNPCDFSHDFIDEAVRAGLKKIRISSTKSQEIFGDLYKLLEQINFINIFSVRII